MNKNPTTRLRLLSGLATQQALISDILPAFTANTGIQVDTVFEPTSVLLNVINDGEPFDVLLGVTGTVQQLADSGHIRPDSVSAVARSGIGVAVTDASTDSSFTTADEFITTLRGARSVAYSRSGASGIYFAGLLDRLGIRAEIDAKATVLDKGFTATALFDGRADIAIQQVSELLSVPGAVILGTLPPTVQFYTDFAAGVSVASLAPAEAVLLAGALITEDAQSAYVATGLIRPD
ncbi:MAG: Ribulose-5-phosphate 4-epimerase-related epimerase and aldolase [Subtercola sp.]|jgi:molybdate transport system substrate-binding protein|nr:Ribulose-5-phosphate 4-epimerase-related epimerase and aldolase [Subtercola sp.]